MKRITGKNEKKRDKIQYVMFWCSMHISLQLFNTHHQIKLRSTNKQHILYSILGDQDLVHYTLCKFVQLQFLFTNLLKKTMLCDFVNVYNMPHNPTGVTQ